MSQPTIKSLSILVIQSTVNMIHNMPHWLMFRDIDFTSSTAFLCSPYKENLSVFVWLVGWLAQIFCSSQQDPSNSLSMALQSQAAHTIMCRWDTSRTNSDIALQGSVYSAEQQLTYFRSRHHPFFCVSSTTVSGFEWKGPETFCVIGCWCSVIKVEENGQKKKKNFI